MSNSPVSKDVIEIDDDNEEASHKKAPTPFSGINSLNFPKLYSILQRHQQEKEKAEAEKKNVEVQQPKQTEIELIKNENTSSEVFKVVQIMPSIEVPLQFIETPQNAIHISQCSQERPQLKQSCEQNDGNLILMVEEANQPLISLNHELPQKPQISSFHQENQEEAVEYVVNSQVCPIFQEIAQPSGEILNIIQDFRTSQPLPQQTEPIQQKIAYQELPQQQINIPQEPDQPIIRQQIPHAPQLLAEPNAEGVGAQQARQLPNAQIREDIMNDPVPLSLHQDNNMQHPSQVHINNGDTFNQPIQIQSQFLVPNEIERKEAYDISKIKIKILEILPDMSEDINNLSDKDILQIYKAIQSQIEESNVQTFINKTSTDQKFKQGEVAVEPIQPKEKQIVEENLPEGIHQVSINVDEEVKDNPLQLVEKVASNTYDEEIHPFYSLKKCTEADLRSQMLKYFPQARSSLLLMTFQELKDVLDEALVEIQKQTKSGTQVPNSTSGKTRQNISVEEMRKFLIEMMPNFDFKLQEIDKTYIKALYEGVNNSSISRDEFVKQIEAIKNSNKGDSILQLSLNRFPQLASQKKLNEQEVKGVYKDIQININGQPKSNQAQLNSDRKKIDNKPQERDSHSPEPNLKRNYETMISLQPRKTDEQSQAKRRSSMRAKLIAKLPNLKDNIMQLNDNQIEKIYNESVYKDKSKKPNNFEVEAKPVIIIQEKKPIDLDSPSRPDDKPKQLIQTLESNGKPEVIYENHNDTSNTHIIQVREQPRKKKTKTIVLMHTEEVSEDQSDSGFKMRMTSEGIQKKLSCSCLQGASIGDILKKLTQVIEKKK